jgi:hypothetical protein
VSHPRLEIKVDGRTWRLFPCSFDTADGKFGFTLYALSLEHAAAMLAELKAVGDGGSRWWPPIEAIIPAGDGW